MRVYLRLVLKETLQSWTLTPEHTYTLGSSQSCDIPVNLPGIAERHLEFGFNPFDGIWYFRDLSGTGQLFIHEQRVTEYTVQQQVNIRFAENLVLIAKPEESNNNYADVESSLVNSESVTAERQTPKLFLLPSKRSKFSTIKLWFVRFGLGLLVILLGLGALSALNPKIFPNFVQIISNLLHGIGPYPIFKDNKWGYIDQTGIIIIPPKFEFAQGFDEDLAAVAVKNHKDQLKWGFIDRIGRTIIEPQFSETLGFSEGLAAVNINGNWGFIDRSGKTVIEPQFTYADSFSENLALVGTAMQEGFINKTGKFVISTNTNAFSFAIPSRFNEGLCKVRVNNQGWGFIDTAGRVAIQPQFMNARNFKEGLAAVMVGDQWGFIDKVGKISIQPQFLEVRDFSEGLAAVNINGKWGFINTSGLIVIQPQFKADLLLYSDTSEDLIFEGGWARVKVDGKTAYINKEGKVAWREIN